MIRRSVKRLSNINLFYLDLFLAVWAMTSGRTSKWVVVSKYSPLFIEIQGPVIVWGSHVVLQGPGGGGGLSDM